MTERLFLCIVVNLSQCALRNENLSVTKSRNSFDQNKEFCQKLLKSIGASRINLYAIFISIFTFLQDQDFVEEIPARWSANKSFSQQTAFSLKEKGEEFFSNKHFRLFPLKKPIFPNDLLAFTASKNYKYEKIDNNVYSSSEEYRRKEKKMREISDYFESIDQSIIFQNTLTSKSIIDYLIDLIFKNEVHVVDFQISIPEDEYIYNSNYQGLGKHNISENLNKEKIFCIQNAFLNILKKSPKRVFCHCNGSCKTKCFQYGGRLYNQTFSYLKKELRKNFYLGNERLFGEYDFSAMHPRMLFYLSGKMPPGNDLYTLTLFPEMAAYGAVAQRKLVKKALLVSINSKSFTPANIAFKKAVKNDCQELSGLTDNQMNLIFDKAVNSNQFAPIRQYFFENKGIELQRIDSDIITDSLSDLFSKDIPVISLHDSVFFTTRDEDQMKIIHITLEKNYVKHLTKALKANGHSEDEIKKLKISPNLKFKAV